MSSFINIFFVFRDNCSTTWSGNYFVPIKTWDTNILKLPHFLPQWMIQVPRLRPQIIGMLNSFEIFLFQAFLQAFHTNELRLLLLGFFFFLVLILYSSSNWTHIPTFTLRSYKNRFSITINNWIGRSYKRKILT